jgi:O-antigen/teichoic acid export membrane protein
MQMPDRNLLATLALRIFGGAAGTFPPLIALVWLNRAEYGHAMANYAFALLLIGPITQFITQGYLRALLHSGTEAGHSPGTGTVLAYVLGCVLLLALGATVSVWSWVDAALIATMVAICALSRVQEGRLIAGQRQNAAVLLFYVLPPLLHAGLILGIHATGTVGDFWNVAISQIITYGGCVAASRVLIGTAGWRAFRAPLKVAQIDWRADFGAARQFLVSGAVLSATENIPIVFLNGFGLAGAIPSFELARKIASVPSVIIHALNMHFMPGLVRTARDAAWDQFRSLTARFTYISSGIGTAYIALVLAGLALLQWVPVIAQPLDTASFVILLTAAVFTSIGAPVGSALVALNGEKWWTLAAGASLVVQLAISVLALKGLGAEAIALSILAQVIVLRAIVALGTWVRLSAREKQGAVAHAAS